MGDTIREVFSPLRPIGRNIEKVIDYYAQEEERLAQEIAEYEITDNIEECFRKFLDSFEYGVSSGEVTEIGIWVSGFYGSGKSSFTKYLGAALDPAKIVKGRPFLELLCERFPRKEIPARLRTVAKNYPTAVIFLDLGSEQLAESAAAPVSTVLYWKVLQWAGYSKEKKIAQLELTLDRRGKYEDFKAEYEKRYGEEWERIHNDPLIGVARASEVVSSVLPDEFPTPESFRNLRFEEARDVRDLALEIIDLCRRKTGCENVLFLIDEAGQYVAPRGELILNLDGLARNFKELGKGKVWIIATGQQTLSEIVEKAAHNSAELNKLRDRFPISIHLDAHDIREITYRRLLTKSEDWYGKLKALFNKHGQSLVTYTRLSGTKLFKGDPDADTFARLYPFLPQHFDLLLELIRSLARSTGGIGLRSAIRVIQDVLVDKSGVLKPGLAKLADREVGTLACVDNFYDTLRADIARVFPHVVLGVDKVTEIFGSDSLEVRVAKAVAALQPIDNFPRSTENIAALLYPEVGAPPLLEEVKGALERLSSEKECGLVEDPQAGGWVFLSDAVKPLRDKRNSYIPTSWDVMRAKIEILKQGTPTTPLFQVQPSGKSSKGKEVRASVKLETDLVVGSSGEVELMVEFVEPSLWGEKRKELLVSTNYKTELRNTVVLLAQKEEVVEDLLAEIVRSEKLLTDIDERGADRDVAQFLRSERRLAERNREQAATVLAKAMMEGVFIFRGKPVPVREKGDTLEVAIRNFLSSVVIDEIFPYYHLAPIRPSTDIAKKFLEVQRLDRITKEQDPLGLVSKVGGTHRVDVNKPVLAEVLGLFREKAKESGTGRLDGRYLQDLFSSPPYGWTKDTVRYLFAALLRAGEVEFHVPDAGGPVRTPGPESIKAVASTQAFNRVGVSPRDSRPSPEALLRTATRLEELFGDEVLPEEESISRTVRRHIPDLLETIGALPHRLRLLDLPGEDRAKLLIARASDLLKGDAGNVVAVLGGEDCSLQKDIQWAREVSDALESGAEKDVKKARDILASLGDLDSLFPGLSEKLMPLENRRALEEILSSETFYEKLPDLRALIREAPDRARELYRKEWTAYQEGLRETLNQLEAHSNWLRLTDEDREEIAGRLKSPLSESPDAENVIRSLGTLLVRKQGLSALLNELLEEVKRRTPPEPAPEGDKTDEEVPEEVLDVEVILPPKAITTPEELDAWLASLREKLLSLLKARKKVRIKGR